MNKSFVSPLLGIASCILIIMFCASNPLETLQSLFTDTFTSRYYFGNMLNTATFLMIAGTGSAIAIRSGNMNLGGEGQVYIGGFIGCIILNSLKGPAPVIFFLAMIISMSAGAFMAAFSALLKELRGAKVLLTTFLFSSATVPLIDGLITASKSSSATNMLALPYINDCYKMKQLLPPSPLTVSFGIAIIICFIAWHLLYKTDFGRKMSVWGTAPLFARYCGYSSKINSYSTLALSGALHALTGFFAVTGTYYTCHKGFYFNMGWNALNVALIAKSNPLMAIPTSIILSWLFTSASRVSLTQGFNFDIAGIVQGVILFSIAIPKRRKL